MIKFKKGKLTSEQEKVISSGFQRHSASRSAPPFEKERLNWLVHNTEKLLIAALTADFLWDWLYIDELWVHEDQRGKGLGTKLMNEAEHYARENSLTGIWLWTQSWQDADFYIKLEYTEFTRFPDFPKGHSRIGFRKILSKLNNNHA